MFNIKETFWNYFTCELLLYYLSSKVSVNIKWSNQAKCHLAFRAMIFV